MISITMNAITVTSTTMNAITVTSKTHAHNHRTLPQLRAMVALCNLLVGSQRGADAVDTDCVEGALPNMGALPRLEPAQLH